MPVTNTRHQSRPLPSPSTPASVIERARARHQRSSSVSPSTPASVTEYASVRHRAHPCPSPALVISTPVPITSTRHQHPSPIALALVTEHTSARHRACQRPSPAAMPVTSTRDAPDVTRPRARPRVSKRPAPARAPNTIIARLAMHSKSSCAPNVHSSVQPSHPTLKHFLDSFLVNTPKPRDPKERNAGLDKSPHSGPYIPVLV
ncbi:hypothetical protein CRG98_013260 [Punica granatum]|uniref:Uncharacterized protein n=1 Tax=Punica granatum TaxID=22663 RepID=A0A2I0KCU1_PUNGR|nr:hypothetical protein CRG98_013260 [Punica granatum]